LLKDLDLDILQVFKSDEQPKNGGRPQEGKILEQGDILRIRGSADEINRLLAREDISLKPPKMWYDYDLEFEKYSLLEAVIAPDSPLQNEAIGEIDFPQRFGAVVLAIRRHGELQQEKMEEVRLSGGDSVLLMVDPDQIPQIERDNSFVLATEVGVPEYRKNKLPIALGILAAVVGTAALGILPIVVSAVTGAILLVLTGCLNTEEAHQAINWKVIFLLGGVLPLGIAMDKTGAAQLLSEFIISHLESLGPRAILSGFFLLSMLLTNVVSNQATAALLAPIVIQSADSLGISPRPFLMAITFAASLSFMTPVGYQTNTLVYGPGQYKFTDYTKVGTPLNIIFWIIATLLIPVFWHF
jgi:di/tricarboxylate transporter